MYPDGELNELAVAKLAVRQKIYLRRQLCVLAARRATQPLEKIDDLLMRWRRISPMAKLAAVPVAVLLKRTLFKKAKILGTALRWGPLAFKIFRGLSAAR
jgi:hypothetical protein